MQHSPVVNMERNKVPQGLKPLSPEPMVIKEFNPKEGAAKGLSIVLYS
jgi:hypothetical protein